MEPLNAVSVVELAPVELLELDAPPVPETAAELNEPPILCAADDPPIAPVPVGLPLALSNEPVSVPAEV
jgi:hypothetical protein